MLKSLWRTWLLLHVICFPNTEWVKDDQSNYKVKWTMLTLFLRSISLWVLSTVLPTSHNFHWHKERMFLLDAMLKYKKLNLGRIMEREILLCARRKEGMLLFPNLIRLLCEAKGVPQFDQDEEDFVLDPRVQLTYEEDKREEVGEKVKEGKKVEEEKVVEEVPQNGELLMPLQQHILKQEAVSVFIKIDHDWYTQGLGETVFPPPMFPDWVIPDFGPSGHAQDKPADATQNKCKKKKAGAEEGNATKGAAKATATPEKTIELDSAEDDVPNPIGQQGTKEISEK